MIECKGSIVRGDTIEWIENVYDEGGSLGLNIIKGQRVNVGVVLFDSYGEKKQQHTFTIEIISSSGMDALPEGKQILRKGRTLHRFGPKRELWDNEEMRENVEAEKRARGATARLKRDIRLKLETNPQFEILFG